MAMNWAPSHGDASIKADAATALRTRLVDMVREWRRRARSRRELASLSYLEIRDIGKWDQIDTEKCKPFWRA